VGCRESPRSAALYERPQDSAPSIALRPIPTGGHVDETTRWDDASKVYAQWVQSIFDLDQDTWAQLVEIYSSRLRVDIEKSLRKRDASLDVLDDIVQETWLTAIRLIRKEFTWVDEERFYRWLRVIALNHVRTYLRYDAAHVSLDDGEDNRSLDDFMNGYMPSVEDKVELHERLAVLDSVIRTLPERDAEILLRRLMGETPRQVAKDYGMKSEHTRMILWRCKKKIEDELRRRGFGGESDE